MAIYYFLSVNRAHLRTEGELIIGNRLFYFQTNPINTKR